jgi:phage terminase Nu1 subunit (DNA packaging protein)
MEGVANSNSDRIRSGSSRHLATGCRYIFALARDVEDGKKEEWVGEVREGNARGRGREQGAEQKIQRQRKEGRRVGGDDLDPCNWSSRNW